MQESQLWSSSSTHRSSSVRYLTMLTATQTHLLASCQSGELPPDGTRRNNQFLYLGLLYRLPIPPPYPCYLLCIPSHQLPLHFLVGCYSRMLHHHPRKRLRRSHRYYSVLHSNRCQKLRRRRTYYVVGVRHAGVSLYFISIVASHIEQKDIYW